MRVDDSAMDFGVDDDICSRCAGNDVGIKRIIRENGDRKTCTSCKKIRQTLSISAIGDLVADVFDKYAKPADETVFLDDDDDVYAAPDGREPLAIICDILECEENVGKAVHAYLIETAGHSVAQGGYDYYADGNTDFDLVLPDSNRYQELWREFSAAAKHKGRFFNRHAEDPLTELVEQILKGEGLRGKRPVISIGTPASGIEVAYRARLANTLEEKRAIYSNASRELGPPPPALRLAGRMNAVGVRVFYGATDTETAVAEVRTPVGGNAIVGKFRFTRRVRVLDFRRFDGSRGRSKRSWFDKDLEDEVSYDRFIAEFHRIIRTPVLPGNEALEYVPTQMFAEYLGTHGIEGIIFRSALLSDPDPSDKVARLNLVLFERASIIKNEAALPRKEIVEVALDDDGYEESVFERVDWRPARHGKAEKKAADVSDDLLFDNDVEPTLQLIGKALQVVRVKAIQYQMESTPVRFQRTTARALPLSI